MRMMRSLLATALVVASAGTLVAQGPEPKPAAALKFDIVLTRSSGEKKLASIPYTMYVTARGGNGRGYLRMGVDVPTGSRTSTTSQQGETTTRFDYRNVGTNIDLNITQLADGRYEVQIQLSDSSIHSADQDSRTVPRSDPMAFRSFSSTSSLLMREGQPAQFVVGTDKVTGETLRADVTMTVLK